eukprot:10483216-Ditylum_brightwellii.AAC.1
MYLLEKTTEDMGMKHPDNFEGKTSIGSTAMLTSSSVLSLPLCLILQSNTDKGVHNNGLLDDETTFVATYHSKCLTFTS